MVPESPETGDPLTGPLARPSRWPWPPLLLAGACGLSILMGYLWPLGWPGLDDLPARVIGCGLGFAGLALIAWSIWTLRAHKTTVIPNKAADHLVTVGPFRWRRNPIYIGDALLMLGAAELTKNIWFVMLVPVFAALVTWLAILPEERHLEAKFGDAWRAYRDRTRRWI